MRKITSFRLPESARADLALLRSAWQLDATAVVVQALATCAAQTPQGWAAQVSKGPLFVPEAECLATADQIRVWRVAGADTQVVLDAIAARLAAHVRAYGWPLAPLPAPISAVLASLRRGDSRLASAYLRAVFPSFWAACEGPAVRGQGDSWFAEVLAYRMGENARGEVFDITWEQVRRAVQVQRRTSSFFQPSFAYEIWQRYVKDSTPVWDPSAGFGARLLGFAAHMPTGVYFANEPAEQTRADLMRLSATLRGIQSDIDAGGSEFGHPRVKSASIGLVFTCPPYFGKERYFDEPAQSWKRYPKKSSWQDKFLRPTLAAAREALVPEGRVVLVVDDPPTYVDAAKAEGLTLVGQWSVPRRRDAFARAKSTEPRSGEFTLEWRKG